jgi:glucoamylase
MPIKQFVRAHTTAQIAGQVKLNLQIALPQVDLQRIAQLMFSLMLRNVATDGFLLADPTNPGSYSLPGCVVAAPSFPANTPGVNQDYVYNWVRDAAITVMELTVANIPASPGGGVQQLMEYVTFAQICQSHTAPPYTLGHACYTLNGFPRLWTEQNDGPALQTLAMLQMYDQLDAPTQAIARSVMTTNINYLIGVYQDHTTNLWEEHLGYSFFARSAQLLCLQTIKTNTIGIAVPARTDAAIAWLPAAMQQHWNGSYYVSILDIQNPPAVGYDPNIDIVCICNFAQLYYKLSNEIAKTNTVPFDNLSAPFFSQIGVSQTTAAADVVNALHAA